MFLVGKETFCDFQSIQQAVDYCENHKQSEAVTIQVLSGLYEEQVVISRSQLTLKGIGHVTIQYGLSAREKDSLGNELGTFRTPTLYVGGQNNKIENVTIINSSGYGEDVGQALAVYADCDETVFRHCRMIGYQDTLFTGRLPGKQKDGTDFLLLEQSQAQKEYRQYYESCFISGTIDFIFGGAAAYFYQCEINSRRERTRNGGYITAASTPENQKSGFVFRECFLSAEEDVEGVFLGRPWRAYAKTAFIHCEYGQHILPAGWNDWSNSQNQETTDYVEILKGKYQFNQRVLWSRQSHTANSEYNIELVFPKSDFYKK